LQIRASKLQKKKKKHAVSLIRPPISTNVSTQKIALDIDATVANLPSSDTREEIDHGVSTRVPLDT
jgi:hypothetical protein